VAEVGLLSWYAVVQVLAMVVNVHVEIQMRK
jgi:hypothetical protein